jgi:large subunit ribosomal protein L9
MKRVILQENVENVGQAGQIVSVSDGFARNFLLPRRLGLLASEKNLRQMDHQRKVTQDKVNRLVADAKTLAEKIESISCSISRKAGEEDKLFGSVNTKDIEEALAQEGIKVDRKHILLAEPIRILGVFTVPIKIHKDVTANLKLWVLKED